MSGKTTNSQNVFLNSKYRENGFKWSPGFQLPSTLLRTDEPDVNMVLCMVDAEIPYNVYNIFEYNDTQVYPCAVDGTIDANNNFGIEIQVEIATTNPPLPPPGYVGNIKFDVRIPMSNYNVLDMSIALAKWINAYMLNEWTAGLGFADGTGLPNCIVNWNFNTGKYEIQFRISAAGDKVLPVDGGGNKSFVYFPLQNQALAFLYPSVWSVANLNQFNRTAWRWLGATDCPTPPVGEAANRMDFEDNTSSLPAPAGPNESMICRTPQMGSIGLPRFIGVRLDIITRNVGHQHGQGQPEQIEHSTLIGKIMTTAPNGDTLKYLNVNDDFKVILGDKYLNDIRINLTDEYNLPLYIQNDFQICLRVDFIQDTELHRDLLGELVYLGQLNIMGQKELVQEAQKKDKLLE